MKTEAVKDRRHEPVTRKDERKQRCRNRANTSTFQHSNEIKVRTDPQCKTAEVEADTECRERTEKGEDALALSGCERFV